MPIGFVTALVDAIMNGPEGGAPASLTMAGIDPTSNDLSIYKGAGFDFSERALQWWPETINDSIETGWSFKNIAGGSHALAQWASNGGRTITFDVQLSRLMAPIDSRSMREKILAPFTQPDSTSPNDNRGYNVDIKNQIKWLRGFCYPSYFEKEGIISAFPPPVMILNVPNFGLNESGGDTIFCVMTGCDAVTTLAFRDGTPRRATVSLILRQIVQSANGVKFKGFGPNAPSFYNMGPIERGNNNPNAGRQVGDSGKTGVR